MLKLTKILNTFDEVIAEIVDSGYRDDVIIIDEMGGMYTYDDLVESVADYALQHVPSYLNSSYPNCISLNITPYGFSYMKDNVGLGINTRMDRKTGEMSFALSFSFNKDIKYLKHNQVYNYAINNSYDVREIDTRSRKKKIDNSKEDAE